jgi:hypothetical protein
LINNIRSHRNKFLFISFSVSIASTFHHNLLTVLAKVSRLPVPKYPYCIDQVSTKASLTVSPKSSAIPIDPYRGLIHGRVVSLLFHTGHDEILVLVSVDVLIQVVLGVIEPEDHKSIH